jgi:protein-disulfide isomerase
MTMNPQLTLAVGKRDHIQGRFAAPVTLLEYGDYQCASCRAAHGTVRSIQRLFGPAVRFVFRNFPLAAAHPDTVVAAEAAEAAGAQGKFWEMHDLLFENQGALKLPHLLSYAERISLDVARWQHDLAIHAQAHKMRQDFTSGLTSGVNGTPTFFLNGQRHDGPGDERTLLLAIEESIQTRNPSAMKGVWA